MTQNNSETGETHTLTRLHPGHFFGEMSLMNEEDQTVANVVCGDKPVVRFKLRSELCHYNNIITVIIVIVILISSFLF